MTTPHRSGYAPVNGLDLYYEIHGTGRPLVVLHGAYMSIEAMGALVPRLAASRQVIAVDLQGHGHTADADRPLTYEQMADDVAGLLDHLEVDQADVFGYSMGGGVALQVAVRHPDRVRRLVLASVYTDNDGAYPEMLAAVEHITPEMFDGSPWREQYDRLAPNPGAFPVLVEKLKALDLSFQGWPPETVQFIAAPTLLVIGDADVIRPEHAVEMFRWLGGGVPGDLTPLTNAQLAILPGTTHVTVLERVGLLLAIIPPFLDAPLPSAG